MKQEVEEREMKLKPLGWGSSITIFLFTAIILRVTHYVFAPAYMNATGKPYLVGYLIGWVSTMFLFFLASLIAYKLDGHQLNKKAFISRFRLVRMERADWFWTLAMIIFAVISLAALSFTQTILKSIPFFSPHPAFPPDMVDMASNLTPGYLFEMPLRGKWWLIGVYFLGWFLNIAGEEFWYRGWMLPRQEVAFGKFAWLINGLMFNFQHTFQPWNMLAMLPGSLFVSYAVQRQRKTWMSIIWHGLLNISLLIFIIQGVIS
jgi:membrane protease YdiL (CAAX protease family)